MAHLAVLPLACLPLLLPSSASAQEEGGGIVIEKGRRVSIEYTLTLDDGTVAETNVDGDALVYEQGRSQSQERRQIPPGLERALVGLKAGDSKKVTLTPEEGYGPVDPTLFQTLPARVVPRPARRVGAQLFAESESGERRPARVHEIEGDKIVLDLNHPLAGKTLHFDVRVLSVE